MYRVSTFLRVAPVIAVLGVVVACDTPSAGGAEAAAPPAAQAPSAAGHDHEAPGSSGLTPAQVNHGVAAVRRVTARFHDIEVAKASGYTEQYPEGCAESPEGAQAFHWLNPSLVDGEVDLLTPELLMYEPQADGSMQLIGVDYVIPFDQWAGEAPPTILGMPMSRNEPLGVWAIHIWSWRPNPSGMFAPWNPEVSCRYAG
jgi:hypothetical protein